MTAERLAAVFPGQGTQRPGMAGHLLRHSEAASRASRTLSDLLALDLADVMARGPEEALRPTRVAQAAVFTASVAAYEALAADHEPVAVAGHSVGEVAACWAAGALTLDEACRLIATRGTLMGEAPPGAMVAVTGLTRAEVALVVEPYPSVRIALHNGTRDIVLAGPPDALDPVLAVLDDLPCRASLLRTSHAFHSPDFVPVAARWRDVLEGATIAAPSIPVAMNVDGELTQDPEHIRAALADMLFSEVRWRDCVLALFTAGAEVFVECGDSQSLCRLGREHGGTWHSFHVRNDWRRARHGRRGLVGTPS